jgi:ADP-ribose pyrophosphatase YjhB (NUDIX family)
VRFCSACGREVERRIPPDDDRERFVCAHCDTVHYQNPKIVVGCLPVWEDKVLLCRRAIEPRAGFWTLPAGFMENSETTLDGARRETWEEARARTEEEELYTLFDLPHISQVYMFYRARLSPPEFAPGPESIEVALFGEEDIPWEDLAFPVVSATLEHFFADRREGHYRFRARPIHRGDWAKLRR